MLAYATFVIYLLFDLYMTSDNTTYIDIIYYFLDQNKQLCKVLLAVRNLYNFVIYILFNLYMASNNTTYINIVYYFLNQNKQFCKILLAVRNIYNNHIRKNQAKAIFPILDKYLLKAKLEYFIIDNIFLNNICIIEIIDLIRFNLDAKERRLQYIRYIINLITKTFIFDNKYKSFKADIAIAESINNLKIVITF